MKREAWMEHLIEALTDLADLDAQARAWITRDYPGWFYDPGELCCSVFDDTAIREELDEGLVFTPEIDDVLSELALVDARVDVKQRPEALLKDPDWLHMAALARRAAQMLKALEWED